MSRRLTFSEKMESMSSLYKYYKAIGKIHTSIMKRVVVEEKNSEKIFLDIATNIVLTYESNGARINIMWEDYGLDNYKEFGLFGYYDCAWVPMEYNDETLIVDSSDSDKLIKVYV